MFYFLIDIEYSNTSSPEPGSEGINRKGKRNLEEYDDSQQPVRKRSKTAHFLDLDDDPDDPESTGPALNVGVGLCYIYLNFIILLL